MGKCFGKCPPCQTWNAFSECKVEAPSKTSTSLDFASSVPIQIGKVKSEAASRISTGFSEFNRVLGGGIVAGSAVLLSGDPGVGKSTLLLELAKNITHGASQLSVLSSQLSDSSQSVVGRSVLKTDKLKTGKQGTENRKPKTENRVLYVSGEESEGQIKIRAERIGVKESDNLFIFSNGNLESVIVAAQKINPDLLIIDSIQAMASDNVPGFAGSLPQIRHATSRIVSFAKKNGVPVFIIGHVTKEGEVAGPMSLSHMVDCVLYLESCASTPIKSGQTDSSTRILRAFKNRFGDSSEVGIFAMEERGIVEVRDSGFFMDKNKKRVPGSCLTVVMEGTRPLLCEIQALVVPSNLSYPRRVSNGIASTRIELLLAVMQKHAKIPLDRFDVYVNVVSGLRITETAGDLAACLALVSSFKNKPINAVAIAEIGLLGELKEVSNIKQRMKEAKKFGFKNIITSEKFKFLQDVIISAKDGSASS